MKKYVHLIFKIFSINKNTILLFLAKSIFIICISLIFFMIGRIFEKIKNKPESIPITFEQGDAYCVLSLEEINPFSVKGKINIGDVRIVAGDDVISGKNINFSLNTKKIFRSLKFAIPRHSKYFASKKGKKIYPISNIKKLEKMSVENLIFFNNLENAKAKGYRL